MPTDSPNQEPAPAPLQGSLSGCRGAGGVQEDGDDDTTGGGSDAGGGVPSLSAAVTTQICLQTLPFKMTFIKKTHVTLQVYEGIKQVRYLIFSGGEKNASS